MTSAIVVIEDNRAIRGLTTHLLSETGRRVIAAANGEDGLAFVLRERPQLVLLDLGLPGIDGYEVFECIRSGPRAKRPIVVAFTATVLPGERERILARGFDAFIEKPIDPARFVHEVETLLDASSMTTRRSASG